MKKYIFPILIVVISLIPLLTLLHPGLPKTHDGQDHVARIANFYLNLTEGNFIPRWAPLLNWGYGHPILMFLYPLPSYIASVFHALGFNLVDSVKIVFGLSFILSGLAMYVFVKSMFGRYAGFTAGILYMFAPYRFVDLYVRGAIGEHVAFIFPPLVCYFLYQASKTKSPYPVTLGALSLAGLLLSHNAVSLMFLPVFLLFVIYLLYGNKKRRFFILQTVLIFIFGGMLSGFFLFPAFLEGKYTLRDIVTENEYLSRFETLSRFIYSPWDFGGSGIFSVQVGLLHWVVTLFQPVLIYIFYKRKKLKFAIFTTGVFLAFLFSLFLMTAYSSSIYETLTILQKFQFPWRFLTLTVFLTSVMGGLLIFILKDRLKLIAVLLITTGAIFASSSYWQAHSYLSYAEDFYTSVYKGTTDTGESAPIWSVRFMLKESEHRTEVVLGRAVVTELERSSTARKYEIIAREPSRIVENTLYFPGWRVLVNGAEESIEFQDPNHRGLITYLVPEGKNDVSIFFENTKLRSFSEYATIVGVLVMVIYFLFFPRLQKWKAFR